MTKVKFCGLRRPEDIHYANELHPDYIGFVFASKSKRCVLPDEAKALKALLDETILAVGVFVNAPLEQIQSLVQQQIIHYVQLHGSENETYVQQLRDIISVPIIQAFSIETIQDVKRAVNSSADYILLDAKTPGGGQTFDWSLLQSIQRPFFLAGGLDPDNVVEAISSVHPYAVDVSSGIETDGYKDIARMRAFMKGVKEL